MKTGVAILGVGAVILGGIFIARPLTNDVIDLSTGDKPDWSCVSQHADRLNPDRDVQNRIMRDCGTYLEKVPIDWIRIVDIADELDVERSIMLDRIVWEWAEIDVYTTGNAGESWISPADAAKYREYWDEWRNY